MNTAIEAIKDGYKNRKKYNFQLSTHKHLFYAIKAIICIKLKLKSPKGFSEYSSNVCTLDIGCYNYHSVYSLDCMSAYEWTMVIVGCGIIRGWFIYEYNDGNC